MWQAQMSIYTCKLSQRVSRSRAFRRELSQGSAEVGEPLVQLASRQCAFGRVQFDDENRS